MCLTPWWKTGQRALIRTSSSGKPRAGPEAEAGQVEPARLVPRALEPLLGQVAERLPEGPEGRGGPLVARDVEDLLEPLDQPRRAGSSAGAEAGAERGADRRDRRVELGLLDDDPVGLLARDRASRRRAGRPGPRSWIWSRQRRSSVRDWHQSSIVPTSVTRAARLTGTRSAFALRPTRIRLWSGGSSRIESGSAATRSPGLVVGPDRAAGQREGDRLAHQEVEVVAVDRDLVPFLGVAGDDAEPGLVGLLGLEPDVERPGRAAADPDAAAAADDPVIGRPVGHGQVERGVGQDPRRVGGPGVVGEPRGDRPRRSGRGRSSGVRAPPLKRIASGRAGRSSG